MPTWLALIGAFTLGAGVVLFRSARGRIIYLMCVLPLAGFAWVLLQAGANDKGESQDTDTQPTVFGDGKHELGASHAGTGAAPEADQHAKPQAHNVVGLLKAAMTAPGFTWPDEGQTYTAATLWNRINGAAEHYKKHGLKQALFATAARGDTEAEVQIFALGSADNARGLWDATERDPKAAVLEGVGDAAVSYNGGAELRLGEFVVRVILSVAQTPENADVATGLITAMAGGAPAASADTLEGQMARMRAVDGLTWPDPGQRYTTASLWNRINGAAEHYKKHGLKGALFATARVGNGDIEVQLFDMGSTAGATAILADEAKLFEGGGEMRTGRFYLRIVLSTLPDSPALEAGPRRLLEALGARLGDSAAEPITAQPKAPKAKVVAPPTPEPAGPNIAPEVATRFGLEVVQATEDGAAQLFVVKCSNAFAAHAWAKTLERSELSAAIVRGSKVVWALGPTATERAETAAKALKNPPLKGSQALKGAGLDPRMEGWGGRAYLGPALVGTFPDDIEVFITWPQDPKDAFAQLKESFPGSAEYADYVSASDLYQGDVLFALAGDRIVGITGFEDRDAALKQLRDVLSRL